MRTKVLFTCRQCDNRVHIAVDHGDEEDPMEAMWVAGIEAWCCTRHSRPVRMEPVIEQSAV